MEKNLDTLKFESRQEVQEMLVALEEWKKEHPADCKIHTIDVAIKLLDNMDMCW